MPLAGLVGGICGGPLLEYLGRKNTILGTGKTPNIQKCAHINFGFNILF